MDPIGAGRAVSTFEQAFAILIGNEGGYVNNPDDPGGETKFGLSKRSYPQIDIAKVTLDDARAIYRRDFWNQVRGDELPPPLALLVFDAAVNSGPAQSVRWLQAALGTRTDGIIGPVTLGIVAQRQGQGADLLVELLVRRALFMVGLRTWRVFGTGWLRRLFRLGFQATRMSA